MRISKVSIYNFVLLFFILLILSTESHSAWDSNSRFNARNLTALDSSLDSMNTRRVLMNMETQLNASQYKALKGYNQSATFNAPVPATTTGTLVRTVPVSKNSLGSAVKKISLLAGATPIGLGFQVALLAGGYLLSEYLEGDDIPDGYQVGDLQAKYPQELTSFTYGEYQNFQGVGGGNFNTATDLSNTYNSDPSKNVTHHFEACAPYSGSPDYYAVCRATKTEVIEIVPTPATDEQIYDSLIDNMTDQEFEDFLNDENAKPHILDIPEIDSISDDTSNDFDTSTDFNPDGTPNQNTNPYTNDENDDNLDSLSVPDYDASELNNSDPQTNPDPNTDPNENPNNNYSPDPDSGNDPEPNYTLNYQGGHEWTVPDFYTQKYPEGLQKAWTDNEQNFDQTAIVAFLNSFVDGIPTTGTCPSWLVTFNLGVLGNYGSHDIAPDCNVFTIIKIILLVSTAFLMRSIIFGG